MLTKFLGIDFQVIFMTALALSGFYLVLTHADQANAFVKSIARAGNEMLVITQGRTVTGKGGVWAK